MDQVKSPVTAHVRNVVVNNVQGVPTGNIAEVLVKIVGKWNAVDETVNIPKRPVQLAGGFITRSSKYKIFWGYTCTSK